MLNELPFSHRIQLLSLSYIILNSHRFPCSYFWGVEILSEIKLSGVGVFAPTGISKRKRTVLQTVTSLSSLPTKGEMQPREGKEVMNCLCVGKSKCLVFQEDPFLGGSKSEFRKRRFAAQNGCVGRSGQDPWGDLALGDGVK